MKNGCEGETETDAGDVGRNTESRSKLAACVERGLTNESLFGRGLPGVDLGSGEEEAPR